ncbi:MAG: acetyl-CoA hydrolase/transferase C-terminal domain-containing protein [Acidobacteriota bacterium]|nr:4-hydroxybutyrate CoA-transferase [Blastocatellia bacterium]MDW8239899.1 acetyl-CoA hydrolase/transferase C-terminal domain-containing protein [Acidobacteriota bacterium]
MEEYKKRWTTAEEAVGAIRSGNRVYLSGNAATPYVLIRALAARKDELEHVQILNALMIGDDPLSKPGMEGHFRYNSLFVGSAIRDAVNDGRADYVPVFLHEIPRLFSSGLIPLDVAMIHTSPPDEHGFMSLGVESLMTQAAVNAAKIVIAQVNDKMPRTLGDCFVHISRIHKLVEVSEALPELEKSGFTEVEKRIGEYIAELVSDGSTLQLGIGGIPDAVLASLTSKRDLGIHTEMVSDGVMEAVEAGIITGARKTLHPRKVIATFSLGSRRLYEYLDNNPLFEFHPSDYTNDPFVIAQNENMVAVNSALEVDLTGQVCADSIGTRIYSGFGGQVDFIRGAARAKGGKPIIALPATAQGGRVSRIVPMLKPGAGVVTTRADVHYVVTEYGVAYLHGKNLRERAEALIRIAHPAFREELTRAARERKLLPTVVGFGEP